MPHIDVNGETIVLHLKNFGMKKIQYAIVSAVGFESWMMILL